MMLSVLLSANDLARELNVSLRHVRRLDSSGKLPQPLRIGRCVRWSRETITSWVAAGCPDRDTWEAMKNSTDLN